MYKKLSFVIPAYNEEKTLKTIVDKILNANLEIDLELIIVNDCSKDSTSDICQELQKTYPQQVRHISNQSNLGKSQSVKKGILESTGDLVVIQDADLEYDPADLVEFVKLFQKDPNIYFIFGNRFGRNNKVIYWQNWIGNRLLSLFSSIFTGGRSGMWTSDMEVCYKMAKGEVFREIAATIESKSTFGFEPEITAKFSKLKKNTKGAKFCQIPITYTPRTIKEGKKMHAISDGLKALKEIVYFNLK